MPITLPITLKEFRAVMSLGGVVISDFYYGTNFMNKVPRNQINDNMIVTKFRFWYEAGYGEGVYVWVK